MELAVKQLLYSRRYFLLLLLHLIVLLLLQVKAMPDIPETNEVQLQLPLSMLVPARVPASAGAYAAAC